MLLELKSLVLLLVLAAAAGTDIRTRRIPNMLTAPAFVLALVFGAAVGWGGLANALTGAGVGLLAGLVLRATGGVGGGDAKLLVVVGAFLGPHGFWWALAYTAIAGGMCALIFALHHRILGMALRGAGELLTHRVVLGRPRESVSSASIPYGVPIAIGAVLAQWLGGIT